LSKWRVFETQRQTTREASWDAFSTWDYRPSRATYINEGAAAVIIQMRHAMNRRACRSFPAMFAITLFVALFYAVPVLSGSDIILVCTKDALYSSLYQHGQRFCSIVLDEPSCEVVTPTEYATFDPAVISSRVCLVH
jgi:hypothetical protein